MKRIILVFSMIFIMFDIIVVKANEVNPTTWVAIDGLGRELATDRSKSSSHSRTVGIFYWTWHSKIADRAPININDFYKKYPDKKNDYNFWQNNKPAEFKSKNLSRWPYWNESIFGYYVDSDDYIYRKHAELLADAGVDFVVFDCTNGSVYRGAVERLLEVWLKAQNDGINVPKIVFMLPFGDMSADIKNTPDEFKKMYDRFYDYNSENYKKYNSLYYRLDGHKLLLANPKLISSSHLSEFTVRTVDRTFFLTGAQAAGHWGWLSTYPQAYYKRSDGAIEQMPVGIAQNADYTTNSYTPMNGSHVMGRSYAKDNYSYTYSYKGQNITVGSSITGSTAKSTNTSLYGRNFQQQWSYARSIDPRIVFVTGWNEWQMAHLKTANGVSNAFYDEFNDEYSRDIEPSKGDLKDHYYYQLVDNIRKYKGITPQPSQNTSVTINSTSDWNNANILSYDHYIDGYNRDSYSSGNLYHYVNNSFRNDIKKAKVSYDASYLYFYVETVGNLTAYNSGNWMRLLIDTTKNNNDNWEEFEYILNRITGTGSTLVLEKSNGGWNFTKVGDVTYKVSGNVLEVKIPREYLGQTGNNINFNFKWCDNNLNNGDIMTLYTDGDAAPGGRFAFSFKGTSAYTKGAEPTSTPKVTVTPTPKTIAKGDVNGDGKINSADYVLIRKHIMGTKLNSDQQTRADFNGDSKITTTDYVLIKKIIMGK